MRNGNGKRAIRTPYGIIIDLCNSGSFWQAEPSSNVLAKHATAAWDRNGVVFAGRDPNHPFISEGLNALRRKLSRDVAVP